MLKRADGHVEAVVVVGKPLGEVVDDPRDRTSRNRRRHGQVLLGEEAHADALGGA
jgi:hypothetical protein